MLGKPTGSPSSGQPESDESGQEGEQRRAGERIGALAIARYVKDDGRALILYTRARDQRR
jgi:hypothetical protein